MSETATVPVIAGLVVGIGFILILSLFPVGVSQTTITLSPVLSLVTMDNGKSYNTHSGIYCGQSCDALIFARVLPLPQIPISNGSEIAFRAINYRGQQVDELHLIIQEIKQEDVAGGSGGGPNLIETNIQLAKTSNGNYKVENLPAGMYMINVIADWTGEQNPDFSHSLHRFAVKITTGGNNGNDPSSSPSEIKTGHSNGTVSVVVIPKGAGSQTGKNFEPSIIKVVIGVNNTVRWTNNDDVLSSVVADSAEEDPDFAAATQFPSGSIPANATNYLQQGQSFEFTFKRPGEIHYHSEPHPWLQGTVIVLPPLPREVAALPCENAIISDGGYNNTLYTCPHSSNFKPAGPIVFQLPAPTYKMVECNSTYGCSHRYNYQEIVPANLLSDDQEKQVLDKVMNLPEVRMNAGWRPESLSIQPSGDRWTGHVQLFIDGIKQLPPSQECGWYGQVDIDLETLQVININIIPPRSDVSCTTSQENNTSTANTTNTAPVQLTITGLKDTYKVGEIIDVSATQMGGGCGMPEIVIKDANQHKTVLISKTDADLLCPALVGDDVRAEFSMTWTPRAQGHPIVMNQTGRYELTIEYAGLKESRMFEVVDSQEQEYLISVAKSLPIVNAFLSQYPNATTTSILDHGFETLPEFAKFHPAAILQYSVERQLYPQEGHRQLRLTVIFDANDDPSNTILECRGPISTTVINPKPDLLADVERCIQK